MASSGVLYSNEEDLIKREVEQSTKISHEKIADEFEIARCTEYITENKCHVVGLQFPDRLLSNATDVCNALEDQNESTKFYVMADTSYGNCDVDEVSGQHINVDLIIHYGNASLMPTANIPVLFIFTKCVTIIKDDFIRAFHQTFPINSSTRIVLLYDLSCHDAVIKYTTVLMSEYPYLSVGQVVVPREPLGGSTEETLTEAKDNVLEELCQKACPGCSCRLATEDGENNERHPAECVDFVSGYFTVPIESDKNIDDYSVFYVGRKDSASLQKFTLENPNCSICLYDSDSGKCESWVNNSNRRLMKRYYLVEKAKDANTVGILVGTMAIAGYLDAINHMKTLVKFSGKKSYTFIMGKLNVEKLANFMEIDIFVLIASAENCLSDYSEFYKPVITPYELEIACNPNRSWTGEYVLDFRELLVGGSKHVSLPEVNKVEATVSLISGKVRSNEDSSTEPDMENLQIAVENKDKLLSVHNPNTAVNFLHERSWKGLEQKVGETPVESAKLGRSGIAASYADETNF